jgi:hypothetical protein
MLGKNQEGEKLMLLIKTDRERFILQKNSDREN